MEQLISSLINYGTTCALIGIIYKLFLESTKKDLNYLSEKIEDQNEKIKSLESRLEKFVERDKK